MGSNGSSSCLRSVQHYHRTVAVLTLDAVDQDVVGSHHRLAGAAHVTRAVQRRIPTCLLVLRVDLAVNLQACAWVVPPDVVEDGFPVNAG